MTIQESIDENRQPAEQSMLDGSITSTPQEFLTNYACLTAKVDEGLYQPGNHLQKMMNPLGLTVTLKIKISTK